MKTLDELKESSQWKIFRPEMKIRAALYFDEKANTIEEIGINSGLSEMALATSIVSLLRSKEINLDNTGKEPLYFMDPKAKEGFRQLYNN